MFILYVNDPQSYPSIHLSKTDNYPSWKPRLNKFQITNQRIFSIKYRMTTRDAATSKALIKTVPNTPFST